MRCPMSVKPLPPHDARPSPRLKASLARLLRDVRACRHCENVLPHEPRPLLRASTTARLLIVGQAPGVRAHQSQIPWSDASGDRLRDWMGIDRTCFYDESRIAIIPMGYCYPGRGATGDLPPRAECAELWLDKLLRHLPDVGLTLLIGRYAQSHFLGRRVKPTLTETVRAWREYQPTFTPLPHPSGRNNAWLQRNDWFERQVVPALRRSCRKLGIA